MCIKNIKGANNVDKSIKKNDKHTKSIVIFGNDKKKTRYLSSF